MYGPISFPSVLFIVPQIGSVIQTAAHDYATLVVGRLIGGFGIGMLAMVARKLPSSWATGRLYTIELTKTLQSCLYGRDQPRRNQG